jgi:nucleotide-binding universal stress UspA family protein
MTYSTLMAHLDVGEDNTSLLAVTTDLSLRFGSAVTGIAGRRPVQVIAARGLPAAELYDVDRQDMADEFAELENEFRRTLSGKALELHWRSASVLGSLAAYVATEARLTDLIVIRPDRGFGILNSDRRTSLGDLVMNAGRPLLVVPDGAQGLDLDHVLVGWNDTREARRAAADAMPLLKAAGQVTVVEVVGEARLDEARVRLEDVVWWLARHGVTADSVAAPANGHEATVLDEAARARNAGLIVAGAYGHNRMREWMLGGVTRDLLLHPSRCTFVSH